MKRMILVFLVLSVVVCGFLVREIYAASANGTCGDTLAWEVSGNTLTIRGEGEIPSFEASEAPWHAYCDVVEHIVIEEGITSIGTNAFLDFFLPKTGSISIPTTLKSCKDYAFHFGNAKVKISDLSAWCKIRFEGNRANPVGPGGLYLNGEKLTDVVIPSDVTSLCGTFGNCAGLFSVTVPESVKVIEGWTLRDMLNLETVVFLGDVPNIDGPFVFEYEENVNVYYPETAKNTAPIGQNYGGELTWIPYAESEKLGFVRHPEDKALFAGDFVRFNAVAIGDGVSYQWQFCPSGSTTWKDATIDGAQTSSFLISPVTRDWDGQVRCVATDKNGNQVISNPARLKLKSTLCSDYTTQLTENTFRYLDEIYIEKYPEMALRIMYGTPKDNLQLQVLADAIAEGCETDQEKADAVCAWIRRNISSSGEISVYPIDVFLDRQGLCLAQAELMQDLLRKMGIPAVVGDGWRSDGGYTVKSMDQEYVDDLMKKPGHAWCFAYLDGEWVMYDPLWSDKGITDREYISKYYYMLTVEWITPVFEIQYLPPWHSGSWPAYIDGAFVRLRPDGSINEDSAGITTLVNNMNILFDTFSPDGPMLHPLTPPEKEEMGIPGHLIRGNTWFHRKHEIPMSLTDKVIPYVSYETYRYENGLAAFNTVEELLGEYCYVGAGRQIISSRIENAITINGLLGVPVGFCGKLETLGEITQLEEYDEILITWINDTPDTVSIDEKGTFTVLQEGLVGIRYEVRRNENINNGVLSMGSFHLGAYRKERQANYSDNVTGHTHTYTKISREATCNMGSYEAYTCTHKGCADTYVVSTGNMLGHSYTETVTPPTCMDGGFITHTCHCGYSYQDALVEAKGHELGQWENFDENSHKRICENCELEEYGAHEWSLDYHIGTSEERIYRCKECDAEKRESPETEPAETVSATTTVDTTQLPEENTDRKAPQVLICVIVVAAIGITTGTVVLIKRKDRRNKKRSDA